ncbi:hypothetical protein H632_c2273p0 [Helicosporidium sp. ATCC 50920]|nr:hypothetical protein H632_c2273p0 [Helicosporidium sp. ATCC 50920]|eukprot:KDD73342.1 hypothetical protein H632_c2273p0 [Helicosporidium sp. ATCC 50920]
MLLLSLAYVALCLRVSGLNYPGGVALQTLHDLHDRGAFARPASHEPLRIHIDVLAAMTGVSRFLERGDGAGERGILYSKVENLTDAQLAENYDVLLSARPDVTGFAAVEERAWPVAVRTKPMIWILKRDLA